MKNRYEIVYFLLSIFISYAQLSFATAQEDFLHANDLYIRGDYESAHKLYESIVNKGAAVWYNLGNCAYHLEHYPEAMACWKRSLRYGGSAWHDDVEHNCNHVQELLGTQPHETWYKKFVYGIMNYSLLWWQLLVIITIVALCLSFLFFNGKKNKILLGALVFVMSAATSCLGIKYWGSLKEYAIAAQDGCLVAGTDERFSKLALLKKGEEILLYEKQGKWAKVATSEGVGWVLVDTIIII